MSRYLKLEWHNEFDTLMFKQSVDIEDRDALVELTKAYLRWNRLDLYMELTTAVKVAQADEIERTGHTNIKNVPLIDSSVVDPIRAIGGGKKESGGIPYHPVPLHVSSDEKNLVFHRHSVISFLQGLAGQAFCGVVMLARGREEASPRAPGAPRAQSKIYLLPVMPNHVNRAGGRGAASYATRPHDKGIMARIYRQAMTPVTHLKPDPSHLVLTTQGIHMKPRYASVPMGNGDLPGTGRFAGFTVQKGDVEASLPNRYAMTSQTLNGGTFGNSIKVDGIDVPVYWPSKAWVESIIEACDKLLDVEAFLRKRFEDNLEAAINKLSLGAARDNPLWQEIKTAFWPNVDRPEPAGGTSVLDRARAMSDSKSEEEEEENPWI